MWRKSGIPLENVVSVSDGTSPCTCGGTSTGEAGTQVAILRTLPPGPDLGSSPGPGHG